MAKPLSKDSKITILPENDPVININQGFPKSLLDRIMKLQRDSGASSVQEITRIGMNAYLRSLGY